MGHVPRSRRQGSPSETLLRVRPGWNYFHDSRYGEHCYPLYFSQNQNIKTLSNYSPVEYGVFLVSLRQENQERKIIKHSSTHNEEISFRAQALPAFYNYHVSQKLNNHFKYLFLLYFSVSLIAINHSVTLKYLILNYLLLTGEEKSKNEKQAIKQAETPKRCKAKSE